MTAIKAQTLTVFIVEFATPPKQSVGQKANWKIFVNRSSNDEESRAVIIMIGPDSEDECEGLIFKFKNEASRASVLYGTPISCLEGQ